MDQPNTNKVYFCRDEIEQDIDDAEHDYDHIQMQLQTYVYVEMRDSRELTDEEKKVLSHISEAFNAFIDLKEKGSNDNEDFKNAANAMSRLIAIRVARRVDPSVWSLK